MKINVEMDKREAKKYFNEKRKPLIDLNNKKHQAGLIMVCSIVVGIILIALIIEGFSPPPIPRDYSIYFNMGWIKLLKVGAVIAFPFIMLSWTIHGVQFRIFA